MGDVAQLAAAGRGRPEGAQATPGPEIPGIAERERPLCLDCRREPLAGGARAERSCRVARRQGPRAGVRLVGPSGRAMRGGEASATLRKAQRANSFLRVSCATVSVGEVWEEDGQGSA